MSQLVSRNVKTSKGRTSIRLESLLWDALHEVCAREGITVAHLIERAEALCGQGHRTSALRCYIFKYFWQAATEDGHQVASRFRQMAQDRPQSEINQMDVKT